ncbi:MAG: protein translocase subunit SecD [Pseudomonadota bacterium]
MRNFSARAIIYGLIVLLGLLSALPNLLSQATLDKLPAWYASNQVTLGLDLRGGSYLLLGVDVDGLMLSQNQQLSDDLVASYREAGLRYNSPEITKTGVIIKPRDAGQLPDFARLARELIKEKSGPVLAYDIETGADQLQLNVDNTYLDKTVTDAVEQSLEVVRRRLDESGLVEPSITRQGQDRIEVQLPGVTEPKRIRELLGTTAKMDFRWVAKPGAANTITLEGNKPGERIELEREVAMEGRHVSDARMAFDPTTAAPRVTFKLDKEGGKIFGEMTKRNVGRQLAVVLDDRVITAPVIRTAITGGSGEISGGFTSSEAADLAVMLRAGALPAELHVLEERTVGASLGSDSIHMGMLSGIVGGLLVLGFMMAAYGQWGLIAWVGLTVNVVLVFGILSLLRGTLTLPGIAGIILGIGMAVDANILINERIREETQTGKKARLALIAGFDKAWAAILDSNVTTLIAISLLISIGSGPVRGFATTMGIGLVTSMFTAIAVTRLLMEWRIRKMGRNSLEISGLGFIDRLGKTFQPGGKVIHFMRAGMAGLIVSAVLSTASVVLMIKPGMEYGIDFSGGALLEVHNASATIEELRTVFANTGLSELSIQEFGSERDFQLRMPVSDSSGDSSQLLTSIKDAVLAIAPDAEFPRAEVVGPRVSGGFADLSILAIVMAELGMLVYLWFRFENHFAMAAVITIALDLTKTIGFFVVTGVEFNLTAVAALLALMGYSVNDKVVVFDRIRENLAHHPDASLETVLDESITTTLTRTVYTSGATFLALLPMAIFGGSAVASFALPLLFGIVVGTSSSIFIAAPILLLLGKNRQRKGLPQLKSIRGQNLLEDTRP